MQNTHQEYLSTERTPTVLDELATLLPPLSEEQRTVLEADILRNGCYSPIIVDESLHIIDGHHRQQICQAHGIPYRMAVFAFDSLLEAKQWMVSTQRNRRNLQPWELGKIALRLKPEIEGRARERQGVRTDLLTTVSEGSAPVSTRRELADAVGLGEVTMGKVMQIDQHAPTADREALDRDELSVSQGYRLTKQLQALPEAEREDAGRQAVELERARRQLPAATDALQWAGWIWRGTAVWDKGNSRPQKGRFRQQAEYIVWGSNGDMPLSRPVPCLPGVFKHGNP